MDTRPESQEAAEKKQVPNERIGPKGMASMQGRSDAAAEVVREEVAPDMVLNASEFKPETKAALRTQDLSGPDAVLADNTGDKAEATAQTVLKYEGLPEGNREAQPMKDVIPGHYDGKHGIDLVGIAPDGRPIPIEVKKRAGESNSVGQDTVPLENMEPETLALKEDILRERAVNPALREKADQLEKGDDPDPDLSTDQMAGLWTRDRWLKLVKSEEHLDRLRQAGVAEEYLDLDNLKVADSPQWRTILDGRTTVIVSDDREGASTTLSREALFKRHFNVVGINLKTHISHLTVTQNDNYRG
jgi:hypothetical protein